MEGLLRCPTLDVVCRGSCPSIIVCGLMHRKASMTTFPFTDWIGSTTTATARWLRASNDCCVLTSTPESQHPKPGWLWYQPTTISGLHRNQNRKLHTGCVQSLCRCALVYSSKLSQWRYCLSLTSLLAWACQASLFEKLDPQLQHWLRFQTEA